MNTRPSGAHTRASSSSSCAGLSTCSSVSKQNTQSKLPSSKGKSLPVSADGLDPV